MISVEAPPDRALPNRRQGSARDQLEREESERLAFLRHQFGVDPDDPRLYDLVVNTGTLSIDSAAALVIEALRRRFPANRPADS